MSVKSWTRLPQVSESYRRISWWIWDRRISWWIWDRGPRIRGSFYKGAFLRVPCKPSASLSTVAILAQGTYRAEANTLAFFVAKSVFFWRETVASVRLCGRLVDFQVFTKRGPRTGETGPYWERSSRCCAGGGALADDLLVTGPRWIFV